MIFDTNDIMIFEILWEFRFEYKPVTSIPRKLETYVDKHDKKYIWSHCRNSGTVLYYATVQNYFNTDYDLAN